ncbi:MFS transporter [Micromonospora haikouensis]|uniref:MFS transporter n=1 Tax=Micromonospora haikouensis TaxID=686309 RepID=UPI0033CBBFEF
MRSPWRALTVVATAQFLVVLTTSIVNVALPAIGSGLALSPTGLSWVVNAYVLAFGSLLLLGGRLGDVLGRRRVFLAGTAVFAVGSVSAGFAGSSWLLVAARGAQGVGAALLAPTALGIVLTLFPPGQHRARALGIWGAVSGIGGAAGVLLSGLLTGLFGWRSVFLAAVPVAAAILVATWLVVPADRPGGGRIDTAGAALVTGGLVGVTVGLSGGGRLWLFGGALLLCAFAAVQRRVAQPLLRPGILRAGQVATANVLMALLGAAWLGVFFFLPLYQQRVLGYSPVEAGLTQLPLALAIVAGSALTPAATRRLGPRVALPAALALLAAGLLWLARTPADGSFLTALAGPSLLIGTGLGVAFVVLTELSAAGVPPADAGLAGGLVNTTRQVGGALGLAVLTQLVGGDRGYGPAFVGAAVVVALAAVLAVALRPTPTNTGPAPTTTEPVPTTVGKENP